MSLATYSPEARIRRGLIELNCAEHNFPKISGAIGKSRLAEGLAGDKDFDHALAERLLETLKEMQALQSEIDVSLDWSRVERVQEALLVRRVWKYDRELNGSHDLDETAQRATESVK